MRSRIDCGRGYEASLRDARKYPVTLSVDCKSTATIILSLRDENAE